MQVFKDFFHRFPQLPQNHLLQISVSPFFYRFQIHLRTSIPLLFKDNPSDVKNTITTHPHCSSLVPVLKAQNSGVTKLISQANCSKLYPFPRRGHSQATMKDTRTSLHIWEYLSQCQHCGVGYFKQLQCVVYAFL